MITKILILNARDKKKKKNFVTIIRLYYYIKFQCDQAY